MNCGVLRLARVAGMCGSIVTCAVSFMVSVIPCLKPEMILPASATKAWYPGSNQSMAQDYQIISD